MDILKLSKPVMIDGQEVTEIAYDLDALTAEHIDMVSKELKKQQDPALVPELDPKFHGLLFTLAAGLAMTDLKTLSAKDYLKAGSIIRNFLFSFSEE